MKRKIFIWIASFLMVLIGILRGLGGISLFLKGNKLATNQPIVASSIQIQLVAIGLVIVCILLISSGMLLLLRNNKRSLKFCVGGLILFLLGGLMNGFLLFGRPVDQGQLINIITVIIIGGLLLLGKSALSKNK